MSREQVSIDDTIEYLNELLSVDAKAIAALVGFRLHCNTAIRDHPTVQVLVSGTGRNPRIGFLGVLNGLFGTRDDGWGEISAIFDESEKLVRFERTPRLANERETVICE